jgi:hypothetical protein
LNGLGSNFRTFSECALIDNANLDFDSAIPRFESWRPSQPVIVFALLSVFARNAREHGHLRRAALSACRKTEDEGPDFGVCLCGPISASRFDKRIARASGAELVVKPP